MAAPNIVNVSTITGVTTYIAGIATGVGGDLVRSGLSTIVSNASGSGKVLKINNISATCIGSTTGVTIRYHDSAVATTGVNTVSIAHTVSVPTFSTLIVIGKDNPIYLEENKVLTGIAQSNTGGRIDIICSYEEIS